MELHNFSSTFRSMSSIASSILLVAGSMVNLLASFLMSSVDFLSSKIGSNESWISMDINKGYYDYYFWCLSGLTALNFFYFFFVVLLDLWVILAPH